MFKRIVAALDDGSSSAVPASATLPSAAAMTTASAAIAASATANAPWTPLDPDIESSLHWLVYDYKNPDNFSGACPSCPFFLVDDGLLHTTCPSSCDPDGTVLRSVLRWSKVVAIKVARNYHAWPVVLVVIPLVIGLVVGYWLGSSHSRRRTDRASTKGENQRTMRDPSLTSRWYAAAMTRIAQHWIPNWLASCITRSTQQMPVMEQLAAPSSRHDSDDHCGSTYDNDDDEEARDERARQYLRSDEDAHPESGVDLARVPKHVAFIMDGNRRHGRKHRGSATSGHYDGSRKLLQVAKWCIAERIRTLTVYAFSTENWNREPSEVAALMSIFTKYCEELRVEAIERNIRVHVLSSDAARIPSHVKRGLDQLQYDTASCTGGLQMNICLSYGGRGEIVSACKALAQRTARGELSPDDITECEFQSALLTSHCPDPDVLIRTSGEFRLSNFLLWQLAYTELFFVDKNWPEIEKSDLIRVIRCFADGRSRRFGQ